MRPSLATLKLVLDRLDVPSSISNLIDRKRVQKAVFLAQAAGVRLGYEYGWYLKGPYSPGLTRDYFALDEALASEEAPSQLRLRDDVDEQLGKVVPLLRVPARVKLQQPDWLELLASILYLETQRKLGRSEADSIIRREKPRLHPYTAEARRVLQEAGLR